MKKNILKELGHFCGTHLALYAHMILGSRKFSIVALVLIVSMSVPNLGFCAVGAAARGASITVIPVLDGDLDSKSRETAKAIASSLSHTTRNHVVDSNLTAGVLNYHKEDKPAPLSLDEEEKILASAKEKFFKFRYEESERELSRAIALLESKRGGISKTGAKLVDAYISRAVIAKSRGDIKTVRDSLNQAIKINPKIDLKSEEYPPSLVSIFEEERAASAKKPSGSISVSTEPAAAEVFINGISYGVSPIEISGLPAGSYSVTIRTNKYEPIEKMVNVTDGGRANVREKIRYASERPASRVDEKKDSYSLIEEGLRVADIMKTDKVVLIDVDAQNGREKITVRMVDRKLNVGQRPIEAKMGDDEISAFAGLTKALSEQAAEDLSVDHIKKLDPIGMANPALLGKNKEKKELHKNPIFWGVVGTIVAGAVGGGLAAAFSGGSGGGGGGAGSVRVNFGKR